MNELKSPNSPLDASHCTKNDKLPYISPLLVEFGKLHHTTQGSTGPDSDGKGTQRTKVTGSDRAIKHNITPAGSLPNGLALYLFDYKPEYCDAYGHGRQLGVMADEVQAVLPSAVSRCEAGHLVVDYSQLGYTMSTVH